MFVDRLVRVRLSLLLAVCLPACVGTSAQAASPALSFDERVDCQRRIEEVRWRHRIWPEHNPQPKPAFAAVVSDDVLREKVRDTLLKSHLLKEVWQRDLAREQLQRELDRIARDSRHPRLLRDLFEALGGDPLLAAECLARPVLASRYLHDRHAASPAAQEVSFRDWWREMATSLGEPTDEQFAQETDRENFYLPEVESQDCEPDSWSTMAMDLPLGRHDGGAVWTGTEVIYYGGSHSGAPSDSGWRYDPATDSWRELSSDPDATPNRQVMLWTGTEVLFWGGSWSESFGARYNPEEDSWRPISTDGAPVGLFKGVWSGDEMLVYQGKHGGRYDPVSDSWESIPEYDWSTRENYTAVWSGTEMIIWGGSINGSYTKSGARYSPATNSWTEVGGIHPTPRTFHTAVWTGSEMIIWGGSNSNYGGSLTSGRRYDPITDTWRSLGSSENEPSPRWQHTAIWTGSEMIIWGGDGATGGIYDPVAEGWRPMAEGDSSCPGSHHTAIWTGSEMIVRGGIAEGDYYPNQAARYSLHSDTWQRSSVIRDVPAPRDDHSAVWTGAEMIVWGGDSGNIHSFSTDTGAAYDPALDGWRTISIDANTPSPRDKHTAVWTGQEMIVWGGQRGGDVEATGGRYNPMTDSWLAVSTGPDCPAARWNHSAIWTGEEMIVWGGYEPAGGRYDPVLDSWRPTSTGPGCPSTRGRSSAVWTGEEMIVWGGREPGTPVTPLDSGGRYDPITDTWQATSLEGSPPSARYDHVSVWASGMMVVWGGFYSSETDGARYDPETDSWLPMQNAPSILDNNALAVLAGADALILSATGNAFYSPPRDDWATTSGGVPPDRVAVWTGDGDQRLLAWGGFHSDQGKIYCSCQPQDWYRDRDGDGYGNDDESDWACFAPDGHVPLNNDCDDGRDWIHPGALEVCDFYDNNCDDVIDRDPAGQPYYAYGLELGPGPDVLHWPGQVATRVYDVVRGDLETLVGTGGDFSTSMQTCVANRIAETQTADSYLPPEGGGGAYYLYRRHLCQPGTQGSYDADSAVQMEGRDLEIYQSQKQCP